MAKRSRYDYKYRMPQRRHFHIWPILLLVAVVVMAAVPFLEAGMLQVDKHDLVVRELPANLKNVEIVFASDFHHEGPMSGSKTEKALNKINEQKADLVILGGDYANTTEGAIDFFNNLPGISARLGVYAILGDCEYTNPELVSQLVGIITGRGIVPLVNSVATVRVGQAKMYIAGSDDYYKSAPMVSSLASQVKEPDFVIFAAHTPELVKDMLAAADANGNSHWYDLALFGHTHGGQLNLFGGTPFGSFSLKEVSDRYRQGWMEENRAAILVSNGIGTEGLPVRLGAAPQVHLITLKAK